MKKFLLFVLIILIVVGLPAWYFLTWKLDEIVTQEIGQATATFGSGITVGEVTTDIRAGSIRIANITVDNPPGYSEQPAISFAAIEAAVDYSDRDITEIIIDRPLLHIEEKAGRTNIEELLETLEAEASRGRDSQQPHIVVRQFRMKESSATYESSTNGTFTDIKISEIVIDDIRGTPEQVAMEIASQILEQVNREVAAELD